MIYIIYYHVASQILKLGIQSGNKNILKIHKMFIY